MYPLKDNWIRLASAYTSDHLLIQQLWSEIEQAYSHKKRHYHNLEHIRYMIEKIQVCHHLLSDADTVLFAVFYHDLVYSPARKDNEEKSAETARNRLLKLNVPQEKAEKCYQQIIATREHNPCDDTDTRYLLDADMAILGETPERYAAYTRNVRKEYAIYPDFMYKKGRKAALLHFLASGNIYQTPLFREQYEEQARKNIAAELQQL